MAHPPISRFRALLFALLTVSLLLPLSQLTIRPAAAITAANTLLQVSYGGNFNQGNTYTSATGETMTGSFVRRAGTESLDPARGLVLGGGTQGMSFTPTDLTLGGTTIDQGVVLEATFTPNAAQGDLATLLSAGSNLWVRYQGGQLRYGFDSQVSGSWVQYAEGIDVPAANAEHTFSLAYLPTDAGTEVHAYLDGKQLPQIDAPVKASNDAGATPIGFGNDVHPAGLDRGFQGGLRASHFATTSGAFDPSVFTLQRVSYIQTALQLAFTGSVADGGYTAGPGEQVEGALQTTGLSIPEPGRGTLTEGALTWDASALGALNQPVLTELMVDPRAVTPGATLIDLMGAVQLKAVSADVVRVIAGTASADFTLPAPASSNGIPNHHIAVHTALAADGSGSVALWVNGAALGAPVSAVGATATGSQITLLGGVTGDAYGVAVSRGAQPGDTVLSPTPCAATTLPPAESYDVTPTECGSSILSKAAAVRPSARQVTWQEAEQTAFLHFGMNTFTGNEWGDGNEDPNLFQPSGLDTDQWAQSLVDNGFRYAILTVKHHDGFVLYPSRYTDHDVAAGSWQSGQGDVLRAFTDSAHKVGLKVGVYLSPADWSQYRKGVFANGSAKTERTIPTLVTDDDRAGQDLPSYTYSATDYGAYFLNQLYETLTEYGQVDEVWFDGADGGIPGASAEQYDYTAWYDLIRKLQPQATIAVSGPDVRWVGNESGLARENESSVIGQSTDGRGAPQTVPGYSAPDLGSDQVLIDAARSGAQRIAWWPSEVDVSIRQGWFYHPDQAPKSVDTLRDIYYNSVGRNSVLLLNIPPDTQGRLPEADVTRLGEWNARLRQDMPVDLALGKPATGSDSGSDSGADAVTDGDLRTSWIAPRTGSVTVPLGAATEVDRVSVSEDIADGGQQVTSFVVEGQRADGSWVQLVTSGTIGYRKILSFGSTSVTALRLSITSARGQAHLAGISAYHSGSPAAALRSDPAHSPTYYLDCSAARAGEGSMDSPLRSLSQLRSIHLAKGATVAIKRGTTCTDPVEIWGYGTVEDPATLTSYGDGAAPVLSDRGSAASLQRLQEQGWTVRLN